MSERPWTELAALRHGVGLTQEALAERAGLSARAVRKLEHGDVASPRRHTLAALAAALELDADERRALFASARHQVPRARGAALPDGGSTVQLPPPHDVLGRDDELDRLATLFAAPDGVGPAVVTGLAGIGKSTLVAEAWARMRSRFPAGRAQVNLTTTTGAPRPVGEVAAELLDRLGVDGPAMPASAGARTALVRDRVAERAVLVVLEDAVDEETVRQFVTGGRARFVVTSRAALGGLDAGARIRLGSLPTASAVAILERARPDLVDTDAVTRLARACAGMPLALRLVAARLTMNGEIPPGELVADLEHDGSRLDGLTSGDRSVRRGVESSLRAVEERRRDSLRLVVRTGARSFSTWHLAAIADCSPATAAVMASELEAGGLVEVVDGARNIRFAVHDLVAAHLRAEVRPLDAAAWSRLTAWAVHLTAASVDAQVARTTPHVLWPARPAGLTDRLLAAVAADGPAWFRDELPGLTALVGANLGHDDPADAAALLAALTAPMIRSGLLDELTELASRCRAAATTPLTRACAAVIEAGAWSELGHHDRADLLLQDAVPHLEGADVCTRAHTWYEVGWVARQRGDRRRADEAFHLSLGMYEADENRFGALGCHVGLFQLHGDGSGDGDPGEARFHTQSARSLAEEFDDPRTVTKVALALCELPRATTEDLARLTAAVERTLQSGGSAVPGRALRVAAELSRRFGVEDATAVLVSGVASRETTDTRDPVV